MITEREAKQPISARVAIANYRWLKTEAARQERSANWVLDKMLTDARMADEAKRERQHEDN